jgi:hypothetical protein
VKSFLFALLIFSAPALMAQESAPTDSDSSARSKVLDLAGAFTNDGYRIRDGFWPGEIEPKRPKILEVNLFAGNEYWFCAAAMSPARRLAVSVYDKDGKPVEMETYSDGASAAAGVEPDVSGQYFVKVDLLEGEKSPFCLLYTYK